MKAKSCPDFILRVNSVLIMWGEEKQASMQGALEDMKNKFGKLDPLHFGGIKFMICYAGANAIPRANIWNQHMVISISMMSRKDRALSNTEIHHCIALHN